MTEPRPADATTSAPLAVDPRSYARGYEDAVEHALDLLARRGYAKRQALQALEEYAIDLRHWPERGGPLRRRRESWRERREREAREGGNAAAGADSAPASDAARGKPVVVAEQSHRCLS